MVPIIIDISGAAERLSLNPEEFKSYSRFVLANLSRRYMELWERQIDNNLHKSRSAYKSGMSVNIIDDFNIEFGLHGKGDAKLGLMIEQGVQPFDIKEGFMQSGKVKFGKNGWYLTIPFRHATSQAVAESAAFSTIMPKPVYQVAKKTANTPLKLNNLPVQFRNKGVRPEIVTASGQIIKEYQHKAAIYEGLVHTVKKNHGQYKTFRRAGAASDKDSWIHKGFTEHDFMGKALNQLVGEFEALIDTAESQFFDDRV